MLGISGQLFVSMHLLAIYNVKALSLCLSWLSFRPVPVNQSSVDDYQGLAAMQQLPCSRALIDDLDHIFQATSDLSPMMIYVLPVSLQRSCNLCTLLRAAL